MMAFGFLAAGAAKLLGKTVLGKAAKKGLGGLLKRGVGLVKKIVPKGTAARVGLATAATYALARPGSGVSLGGIGNAIGKAAGDVGRAAGGVLPILTGGGSTALAQRMGTPPPQPILLDDPTPPDDIPMPGPVFAPAASMPGSPSSFGVQEAGFSQGIPKAIVRGIRGGIPYAAGAAVAEYAMNYQGGGGARYSGRGGIAQAAVTQGIAHGDIKLIVNPQKVERLVAPPGYVIVVDPAGHSHAVLAEVAYALGMKKRPKRGGGISRRDIARARHVQRVIQKLTVKREPKFKLRATARVAGGRK